MFEIQQKILKLWQTSLDLTDQRSGTMNTEIISNVVFFTLCTVDIIPYIFTFQLWPNQVVFSTNYEQQD